MQCLLIESCSSTPSTVMTFISVEKVPFLSLFNFASLKVAVSVSLSSFRY